MSEQEPHGPHRSPEKTGKQFKSINTWLYHNVDLEKKKTLLSYWEFIGSSFEETWIPIIQGCLCEDWLKF